MGLFLFEIASTLAFSRAGLHQRRAHGHPADRDRRSCCGARARRGRGPGLQAVGAREPPLQIERRLPAALAPAEEEIPEALPVLVGEIPAPAQEPANERVADRERVHAYSPALPAVPVPAPPRRSLTEVLAAFME